MNMAEYLKVKDFTYSEYCDYLQDKYGIGFDDYMTKGWYPQRKCKRTNEGLVAHHKKEDTAILLSTPKAAMQWPFEWQEKQNIVYCDYLEHLLLHILICKYPANEVVGKALHVGLGGIVDFIAPELNDVYSGFEPNQAWRKPCYDKIKNDKDVYLQLLKQFIGNEKDDASFSPSLLCHSYNARYGLWSEERNSKIYAEISALVQAADI